MKVKQFVWLFLLGGFAAVNAQNVPDCQTAAFTADPSSGVNVRSEPGLKAKILKTIPADQRGTLVFIEGAKGEWLKVSSAVNSKKTKVFSGIGWVHAPLLSVKTSSKNDDLVDYYESPNLGSGKLGSLRSGLDLNLLGCSGDWIKVSILMRGTEGVKGWLPRGSWCGSPWEDCM